MMPTFSGWLVINGFHGELAGSEAMNEPLSRLRHPLPLRGGEGKGEEAVLFGLRLMEWVLTFIMPVLR
jgi:hypothetical protein